MKEVWISHLQEIALDDDWVIVTDVMGREYRIDTCSRGGYVLLHSMSAGKTGMYEEKE